MRHKIIPGGEIDVVTPDEMQRMLTALERRQYSMQRVRAGTSDLVSASGANIVDVYKAPMGYVMDLQRVVLNVNTATDLVSGTVNLQVAGKGAQYLRSGRFIEWALPAAIGFNASIPGTQTWGKGQGPSFRNGEVFQFRYFGMPVGSILTIDIEGDISEGGALK